MVNPDNTESTGEQPTENPNATLNKKFSDHIKTIISLKPPGQPLHADYPKTDAFPVTDPVISNISFFYTPGFHFDEGQKPGYGMVFDYRADNAANYLAYEDKDGSNHLDFMSHSIFRFAEDGESKFTHVATSLLVNDEMVQINPITSSKVTDEKIADFNQLRQTEDFKERIPKVPSDLIFDINNSSHHIDDSESRGWYQRATNGLRQFSADYPDLPTFEL